MKTYLLAFLIVIIKVFVISFPVMFLLNWIMPIFIGTFSIGYLQTCGVLGCITLINWCIKN